jgi:hypothetical protein
MDPRARADDPRHPRTPDRPGLVEAGLWGAAAALLIVYAAVFALSAAARIFSPYELAYGESIVLQEARRVAAGEALYPPPSGLPLTVTAYTPLYYLVVGALQHLLGDRSYLLGRLVSLAATLGGAACLAVGVRAASGRWPAGALAALVVLGQNLTALLWAPLHRVDALALGLTLLGLALAATGRPLWAVAPLLLAALTKQSYVAAPAAVLVALWPQRRRMALFAALFGLGLAAAAAVGQWLTRGWFLWHVVVANANPFTVDYLTTMLGQFLQYNGLPLLLTGALFSLPERPPERVWRRYFLVSLVQTLASVGKIGASSNYWLEWSAAAAALSGILAVRSAHLPPGATGWYLRSLVGALLIAVPAYQATAYEALQLRLTGETAGLRDQAQLARTVAREPGDVLADEPGVVLAAGKTLEFEPIFTLLAEQGLWDQSPILAEIRNRRFGLVLLSRSLDEPVPPIELERITGAVRDALREAYEPAGQQNGHWLYRPRPQP